MSLVIQGDAGERDRVCRWILGYKELCESQNDVARDFTNGSSIQHQIANKYYSAVLTLLLKDFNAELNDDESEAIEGYVLVPSVKMTDLNSDFYKYSKGVVDADVGLRLLVTFETDGSDADPAQQEQNFNWCLDNNFEHIVINAQNLLETRDLREKSGLPRLMEALESNMWSTMKRQKAPGAAITSKVEGNASAASSATTGTYVPPTISASAPAPTTVFSDLVAKATDVSVAAKQKEEEVKDRVESDLLLDSLKNSLPEDKGYESFDQLSNLIDQAKSFREKAAGGALSDADRRKHAAEFAMKLSAMMSLGDESDSEDD